MAFYFSALLAILFDGVHSPNDIFESTIHTKRRGSKRYHQKTIGIVCRTHGMWLECDCCLIHIVSIVHLALINKKKTHLTLTDIGVAETLLLNLALQKSQFTQFGFLWRDPLLEVNKILVIVQNGSLLAVLHWSKIIKPLLFVQDHTVSGLDLLLLSRGQFLQLK